MKHYALIGDPVEHSLSPAIYGFLFEKYGVSADFSLLRVPAGQAVSAVSLGLDGFACTMPHKRDIIPYLSSVSPEAAAMDSVNIVSLESGRYVGYSTDGAGLLSAIERKHRAAWQRVFIIGSGGAARSAAYALSAENDVTIFARSPGSGAEAAKAAGSLYRPLDELQQYIASCDILINATPLGMSGHEDFTDLAFLGGLPSSALVCDMVYFPRNTHLLTEAKGLGLCTVEGIEMLIGQGVKAFEIWTGIKPSLLIREELCGKISQQLI